MIWNAKIRRSGKYLFGGNNCKISNSCFIVGFYLDGGYPLIIGGCDHFIHCDSLGEDVKNYPKEVEIECDLNNSIRFIMDDK